MELELETVVAILAAVTTLATVLLGYLFKRSVQDALMLGGFAAIACGLCYAGLRLRGETGLLVAILLVAVLAFLIGRTFGKERGAAFVPALWLGFCASCAIGYYASQALGLLTITFPSLLVFWGALFWMSRHLLPLTDQSQWGKAYRCLISFSLGTNHPYHVMAEGKLEERVSGNPFSMLMSGPGIVLTGPAHAPIIWTGLRFNRIAEPGLTFTERFETVYQTVDLRPQFRAFPVEALTKDGIRIRVEAFIAFRLHTAAEQPELNGSFPMDKDSIYAAVWQQRVEQEQRVPWDEFVPTEATRILRRIISSRDCDELCEVLKPGRDPHGAIQRQLIRVLRQQLEDWEIEIISARIGNLTPMDGSVIERRIEAWRSEWEREIMTTVGEGRANAIWELEKAHARAQASLISAIRRVVEQQPDLNPDILTRKQALGYEQT